MEDRYVIRLGNSLFVSIDDSGGVKSTLEQNLKEVEGFYSTDAYENARKIADQVGGVVDVVSKQEVELSQSMSIKRLLKLDFEIKEDYLRATPFFSKRKTINKEYLLKVPTYRLLKILEKIASDYRIENFDDYMSWVQLPINSYDETFTSVKNFRSSYGNFRANRYLLTLRNSIELYLATKE